MKTKWSACFYLLLVACGLVGSVYAQRGYSLYPGQPAKPYGPPCMGLLVFLTDDYTLAIDSTECTLVATLAGNYDYPGGAQLTLSPERVVAGDTLATMRNWLARHHPIGETPKALTANPTTVAGYKAFYKEFERTHTKTDAKGASWEVTYQYRTYLIFRDNNRALELTWRVPSHNFQQNKRLLQLILDTLELQVVED